MIIVIGHKNPDTDSVVSAKMFARFLEKEGKNVVSRIAGKLNSETEFIFSYFQEKPPQMITEDEINAAEIFLVDHNEIAQSVAKKENIYGVLDHHMLSGLKTDGAIFFRIEPVGSTSTLVYKMMKERGLTLDEKEAGMILAGIISDTLNLNSPTTTTEDIDFYYELSEISKIDPNDFAEKMFEAKSDFSGKNVEEIITGDLKEYDFGGKRVAIGVAETTSLGYFYDNESEIVSSLKKIKEERSFDALFFGAVDIVKKNTILYPATEDECEVIKKTFNGEKKEKFFLLKGVSSRKQEIAPPLSEYYEN